MAVSFGVWPFLVVVWMIMPSAWAEVLPDGPFVQAQCVACHETRHPGLVAQWRAGVHGTATPRVACLACHGDRHGGAAAHARRTVVCTGCHGGPEGAVAQSYRVSKHGVIATLEETRWDWSQPLSDGNYRAPTCAYCHMHGGDHAMGGVQKPFDPLRDPSPTEIEAMVQRRVSPCLDCHAPRFARTWFQSGEGMIAVSRMKIREGRAVAAVIDQEGSPDAIQKKNRLMQQVGRHGRHVRLGVFHHSPDHQWWHGHPALDGDVLRLKGVLGDIRRYNRLEP